jgi:hypothetical protein
MKFSIQLLYSAVRQTILPEGFVVVVTGLEVDLDDGGLAVVVAGVLFTFLQIYNLKLQS